MSMTYASDGSTSTDETTGNEGLAEDQCLVAFPGLYQDLLRALHCWTQAGSFTSSALDSFDVVNGVTKVTIYGGQLYIVATKSKAEDHRHKVIATLSSIHRALAAFPDALCQAHARLSFPFPKFHAGPTFELVPYCDCLLE